MTACVNYKRQLLLKWLSIDIGKLIGVVFLDLKKAFDTVGHGVL